MFFNNRFGNVKKVGLCTLLLIQSMALQAESPEVAANAAVESGSQQQQRAYYFPRWPKQQRERKERIPPPPPGPYMSSALSGSSVSGPSFAQHRKPVIKNESSSVSKEAFSPDIAWPSSSNASSPGRWQPESGYNYVAPAVKKQPPNYNYGYRYPYMNWPGSSSDAIPPWGR